MKKSVSGKMVYYLYIILAAVLLPGPVASVFAKDPDNDLDARLAEVKKKHEKIKDKISAASRRIDNSDKVEEIKRKRDEVRKKLRASAMKTPEIKTLEKEEEELKDKWETLRASRKEVAKSVPELVEQAARVKNAKKAYRKADNAGKDDSELNALANKWRKARRKYKKMQGDIPEIQEINEKIAAVRKRLGGIQPDVEKVVKKHPELRKLYEKTLKLQEKLDRARRVSTPELKKLREREQELQSRYLWLRLKKRNKGESKGSQ